ncbi:MAG: formate dehydrogenase subunit alpha [Acidobacteria bacterium]|nr:formate dehydrogenase subunit alpha [Acidobacteriota bacterium]
MLSVTINGIQCRCPEGVSILDALNLLNIKMPSLCHDDRLEPYGGCRLCIVQVKGHDRPVPACSTPLAEEMEIETHSAEIKELRRTLLKLLAHSYPAEAVKAFPDKPFHRYLKSYGVEDACVHGYYPTLADESHPYIRVDMSRCMYCQRCVRICREVQGQFVWQVWDRADATRILPDSGTNLAESSCVACGACADTCPTGALEDKTLLLSGSALAGTSTTCPYCGVGCEMEVRTRGSRIVAIKPVVSAPVNRGHLCVKGRYAFEFVHSPDRITEPMIRRNGEWKPVSWEYAIHTVAEALRESIQREGPQSTAILASARATNEENYLTQKFARVVLGTNNVDCCARVCHAPTATAMKAMLGTGAATNSFNDIERARTILVCGANPTSNHPVIGARIKQAVLKGTSLIVIDPRRIELADYADHHLQVRPGTNVPLLNAIAHTIVEESLFDREFMRERVSDWESFARFIQNFAPEKVATVCGVNAQCIREAARLYATEKPSMIIHGLGVTEHTQGSEGVMLLVNLALLTGNVGKRGGGVMPLRGQNNVQGAAHMGCDPGSLTGAVAFDDGKALFEDAWSTSLPSTPGLNLLQMMDAAAEGKLKTLWAIGFDVFLTNPQAHATSRALWEMDCVVVQDMFLNETAREFGSVFLPAVSSFEKDGTFMNAERRVQRVRQVIEPLGQAKADWEILCLVARAMGKANLFPYTSAEQIWNEIRTVWKAGAGISYGRLEQGGLQWPCPDETHPGTEILHTQCSSPKTIALREVQYRPTPERVAKDFPFLLITGRAAYQFNAGTMSSRTPNVELWPTDVLEMAAADAQRLGVRSGERVRIRSRFGEAELPLQISPALRPGELFTTFHSPQVFLNHVTSPYRDTFSDTPEYKVTAVTVEKVSDSA